MSLVSKSCDVQSYLRLRPGRCRESGRGGVATAAVLLPPTVLCKCLSGDDEVRVVASS